MAFSHERDTPVNTKECERAIFIELMRSDRQLKASREFEIKVLRDLKDLTIHHVRHRVRTRFNRSEYL